MRDVSISEGVARAYVLCDFPFKLKEIMCNCIYNTAIFNLIAVRLCVRFIFLFKLLNISVFFFNLFLAL